MPQLGLLELLVIVVVAVMVFGPNEIPRVARSTARTWRRIQGFRSDVTRHLDEALREDDPPSGGSTAAKTRSREAEDVAPGGNRID